MTETLYDDKTATYYEGSRRELLPFVPKGAKSVLDVGCGMGAFGAELKNLLNARVTGIELNEEQGRRAQLALDEVIIGDVEKTLAALPNAAYDLIVFNDVLEHLIDPWQVLKTARSKLMVDGHVLAAIPNVRHWSVLLPLLLRGDWKYSAWGILDRSHLRFFTAKTARTMFGESNFRDLTTYKPLQRGSKSDVLNRLTLGLFADFLASHNVLIAKG
jgi:2-polyprenyl-3-methyl-5-hydroxy-6-metoxy-1,4-benzoquinol methylase